MNTGAFDSSVGGYIYQSSTMRRKLEAITSVFRFDLNFKQDLVKHFIFLNKIGLDVLHAKQKD